LADAEAPVERAEDLTLVGPAAEDVGLTAAGVEAAGERQRAATGERGRARRAAPASRERRWPRRVVTVVAAVAVVAVVAVLAVWGLRQIYFLGTDSGGRLALYRGLPYDLPLGIHLYTEVYTAPVQVTSIPPGRRDSATDHTLRSHDDAASLIDDLQAAAERRSAQRPASRAAGGNGGRKSGGAGKGGGSPQGGGGGGSNRGTRGAGGGAGTKNGGAG